MIVPDGEYETLGDVPRTIKHLRHEFLRLIREEKPDVFDEFKGEVYGLYLTYKKEREVSDHQIDMSDMFRLLEGTEAHHDPQLSVLQKALREWSQRWNLDAAWCREDAFNEIFMASLNGGEFNDHRFSLILDSYAVSWNTTPPKGLPQWNGLAGETKSKYVAKIRQEALRKIEEDDLLNLSEQKFKNALVNSIVLAAKKYVAEAEARYASNQQLRKIREAPEALKHLKWTVRVRIGCTSHEEAAQAFQIIADEEGLDINAIKKGVREKLTQLGLPLEPTFKGRKGRPPGRRDSRIAPRQSTKISK